MKRARISLLVLGLVLPLAAQNPLSPQRPAEAPQPLSVGIVLLDGVYNSELMAPYDVFQHTAFHAKPGMRVFTVGRTRDVVKSFEGLRLLPDHDLESAPEIDVLVVPSAEHSMDRDLEDKELIAWIAARGARAGHIVSVCDGAFLLAEAGLLEKCRCTTFPGDIPAFRRRYPGLDVREGVSFVVDGKVITGVGGAKSYDPAMYLVETLYGKRAALGIAGGLVIDWNLETVPHHVAGRLSAPGARPRCYLPGDVVDGSVTVFDEGGRPVTLASIVSAHDGTRAVVICLLGGAEQKDVARRGGLWCEDSYGDLPLLRHIVLEYAPRGVLFVPVLCPPIHHEVRFGYDEGSFRSRPAGDPVHTRNRDRFIERTVALRERDVLPFPRLWFDPRLSLLRDPGEGLAPGAKISPKWLGRFKWYADTQTYGTPTIWVLTPGLRVDGKPFFMNVHEGAGRKIRYTVRDVIGRLDRVLKR